MGLIKEQHDVCRYCAKLIVFDKHDNNWVHTRTYRPECELSADPCPNQLT